jgi:hypothetical protein
MRAKRGSSWPALGLMLLGFAFAALAGSPRSGMWGAGFSDPLSPEVRRDYPRECEAFFRWVKQTIVPGRTTRQEIIAIFGHRYVNLDRPRRDSIVTLQYELYNLGVQCLENYYLIFDFDAHNRVLAYSTISLGVCGFCPHIFADDGAWRLEGKLLAGCVSRRREGVDTLLLPRATARGGRVHIQLANLAPEVEFIDQIALGGVPLAAGEELDTDASGRPYVWTPTRALPAAGPEDRSEALEGGTAGQVLVLEVRNTTAFEKAMRDHLLTGAPEPAGLALALRFDDGPALALPPVGTKFLRRVVVPVPPQAHAVRVPANPFWTVRRLWAGTGRPADARWCSPADGGEVANLLRESDGRRLRLGPGEKAVLTFTVPEAAGAARVGYLLRMSGYYEFLLPASGTH